MFLDPLLWSIDLWGSSSKPQHPFPSAIYRRKSRQVSPSWCRKASPTSLSVCPHSSNEAAHKVAVVPARIATHAALQRPTCCLQHCTSFYGEAASNLHNSSVIIESFGCCTALSTEVLSIRGWTRKFAHCTPTLWATLLGRLVDECLFARSEFLWMRSHIHIHCWRSFFRFVVGILQSSLEASSRRCSFSKTGSIVCRPGFT